MGLIDRAFQDQMDKLTQDDEAASLRVQQEHALEVARVEIITRHLEMFADRLGETFTPHTTTPVGLPRYYIIGDIVIMVQQFMTGLERTHPSKPRLLTFEYCTYLVALDANKRLAHRKVGVLKLLSYSATQESPRRSTRPLLGTSSTPRRSRSTSRKRRQALILNPPSCRETQPAMVALSREGASMVKLS